MRRPTQQSSLSAWPACSSNYYGVLSWEIAGDLGNILDKASSRSREILQEDISLLPGFYTPQSQAWGPLAACNPADMGVTVSTKYIEKAKEYSALMWNRSFGGLRLNDKALAILQAETPEITEIRKVSVKEADEKKKKKLKRALWDTVRRINEMAFDGDENIESAILAVNNITAALEAKKQKTE